MSNSFLVDRMLGRLARKLRLLGFDTLYVHESTLEEILELAEIEQRSFITRHRELHSRALKRRIDSFLVKSNDWRGQLRAVFMRFDISEDDIRPFTRCADCNALLEKRDPEDVSLVVPQFVLFTHNHFLQCPACDKVYWKGTHPDRILQTFSGIVPSDGD